MDKERLKRLPRQLLSLGLLVFATSVSSCTFPPIKQPIAESSLVQLEQIPPAIIDSSFRITASDSTSLFTASSILVGIDEKNGRLIYATSGHVAELLQANYESGILDQPQKKQSKPIHFDMQDFKFAKSKEDVAVFSLSIPEGFDTKAIRLPEIATQTSVSPDERFGGIEFPFDERNKNGYRLMPDLTFTEVTNIWDGKKGDCEITGKAWRVLGHSSDPGASGSPVFQYGNNTLRGIVSCSNSVNDKTKNTTVTPLSQKLIDKLYEISMGIPS